MLSKNPKVEKHPLHRLQNPSLDTLDNGNKPDCDIAIKFSLTMLLLIQVSYIPSGDNDEQSSLIYCENASALGDLEENIEIGFYASDGIREATFFIDDNLLNVNVYRIDGEKSIHSPYTC